jgi:large conductance mechanosensitive channel
MVLPMSRFLARRARMLAAKDTTPAETVVPEANELDVLKEIRDTLVSQRGPSDSGSSAPTGR